MDEARNYQPRSCWVCYDQGSKGLARYLRFRVLPWQLCSCRYSDLNAVLGARRRYAEFESRGKSNSTLRHGVCALV